MIDIEKFMEIKNEKVRELRVKAAAWVVIGELADDKTGECLDTKNLAEAEVWSDLLEFCVQKLKSTNKEIGDLNKRLIQLNEEG